MNVRLSHFLITAVLFAPAAFAGDGKMCSSSARECEQAIRQLSSGRRYLGAEIMQLDPGIAIKTVKDDGPAARADLEVGDRLMAINGHSTREASIKDFKQILYDAKATGVLWIIVQRHGILKKLDVRLEPYTKAQIDKMVAQHLAQSHAIATTTPAAPQQ
jgi:Predicted protease with the C-terminal PDZ domain